MPNWRIWCARSLTVSSLIECQLGPSRWAKATHYSVIPILMAFAALAGADILWVLLGGLAATIAAYGLEKTAPRYTRLRWQGDQLRLYTDGDEEGELFVWRGKGRRRPMSIRFDLSGEDGSHRLVIWRDSVTGASWRALHAGFRIQAIALRQAGQR